MQPALINSHIKTAVPDWVGQAAIDRLAGKTVTVKFSRAEKRRLRKRKKEPISRYAERHLHITVGGNKGRWRNDVTPHGVKIMDLFGQSSTREVVFCSTEQDGKTAILNNCMQYLLDVAPDLCMLMLPNQETAEKITRDRVTPMIKASPRMRSLLTGKVDDVAKNRIKFNNGSLLYPVWATSVAATASWPVPYVFNDEVDKMEQQSKEGTDSLALISKRQRQFPHKRKTYTSSTPGKGKFIVRALNACDQIWVTHVVCPDCGGDFRLGIEHMTLPEGATPEEIELHGGVTFACECCGVDWTDAQLEAARRFAKWVCIKGVDLKRPAKVGFHRRAFDCMYIAAREIGSKYLQAEQDVTNTKKIEFANSYMADDFKEKYAERKVDIILKLRDEHWPIKQVPRDCASLQLCIDTQKDFFWYTLRAFKFGRSLDNRLVQCGKLMDFEAIEKLLYESEWENPDGLKHRIQYGGIDTGGGKDKYSDESRTWQVYDFCRFNEMMLPIKGAPRKAQLWRIGNIDKYPGTNKPIPGGLQLNSVNVSYYKDQLASRLEIAPGDPGHWHFYHNFPEEYARHYTSESKNEKAEWERDRKIRNDLWDCDVYQLWMADMLGITTWIRPEEQTQTQSDKPKKKIKQNSGRW